MITLNSETSFLSEQGHLIQVREIQKEDAPLLVDIFDHMSPDSRYKRFHQPLEQVAPQRVWQEAQQIAGADADKAFGLIAVADQTQETAVPVGAARFVATGPAEAEVAISIRDDFQNMGIGRHLMRLLALAARDLGYKTLTASIQNDNPAIWRVFKSLPFEVAREIEGSSSGITINLTAPRELVADGLNS